MDVWTANHGPGQAIGAACAKPGRQVCLLLGDGAFGFAGLEFDTMVRHGLPVVGVMGNNGIWALEKHPMEFLYGYSVAAELHNGLAITRPIERPPSLPKQEVDKDVPRLGLVVIVRVSGRIVSALGNGDLRPQPL